MTASTKGVWSGDVARGDTPRLRVMGERAPHFDTVDIDDEPRSAGGAR